MKDEAKKEDFFKTVFNSILFFKTFLTKEATAEIPGIDRTNVLKVLVKIFKRQMVENDKLLTSAENLYNAAEDLYNDILLQNGYKDNSKSENFKLNHYLMEYIKMSYYIYEHVLGNENLLNKDSPKSDFLKQVFESFFFFKHFLIKLD